MIDAKNDRLVYILTRSRDQDALCACREMLFGADAIRKEAGAFQRYIDAIGGVRQIGWVTFCRYMNTLAVDDDVIAICLYCPGERAVYAVTFKQKGIRLGRCKIVNRDQLQVMIIALQYRTGDQTANATKTVNCYFHCHNCSYQPNRATICGVILSAVRPKCS